MLAHSARLLQKITELEQEIEDCSRLPRERWAEKIAAKEKELDIQREYQMTMINWWKKKNAEIDEWYAELAVPTPGYWEDHHSDLASLPPER